MRAVFERLLHASIRTTDTEGACLHASVLLAECLTRFAGVRARICGGGPPEDGGALDTDGAWRGHYWVEGVRADGSSFVVDIAADQFGWPKVVLLQGGEAAARYRAGDAQTVDTQVREFLASLRADVQSQASGN